LYNPPTVIKTPPQSPHLNVIKNLWAKLEKEIRNQSISNKGGLKNTLRKRKESGPSTLKKTSRILSRSKRSHCNQRIANIALKESGGIRDYFLIYNLATVSFLL